MLTFRVPQGLQPPNPRASFRTPAATTGVLLEASFRTGVTRSVPSAFELKRVTYVVSLEDTYTQNV
jgi:hypothetical protein